MNRERLSFADERSMAHGRDVDDDEIDIGKLVRTLWRGKWLIAALAIFGFCIGQYYATYRVTPYYRASATLTLEVAGEQLVNFQRVTDGFYGDDAAVTTEKEVIASRTMLSKLATELDLVNHPMFNPALRASPNPDPLRDAIASAKTWVKNLLLPASAPSPSAPTTPEQLKEGIVSALGGMIDVTNKDWSYVLIISATSSDAELAALLANTLSRLYIEDRLEVKFEKSRQATEWLTDRVVGLQQEVERSANELKQFRSDADLINADALAAMTLRLKDQRERLTEARIMQAAKEEKVMLLRTALAEGDAARIAAIANDPVLTRLAAQLPGNPNQTRLFNTRLDVVDARFVGEAARGQDQIDALERAVTTQDEAIARQSQELVRVEQLEREAEANRLLYEYFLTRLKETSVQEGLQQADARIISPAIIPSYAFNPNGDRAILLTTLLGLLAGAGLILLKERMITAVRLPDELEEATDIPVLGQIPRIPGRTRSGIIRYLTKHPASAPAEAIRNLRTSLVLSQSAAPPQLTMVTSALPGEGKSTMAVALAQNYAGLGKSVLLIEADIRRRTLAKFLGLKEGDANMLSVLSGEQTIEDAVQTGKNFAFDVLLGATSDINPADLLSSDSFEDLLTAARSDYDVVIVDTPPLLIVPDARIIGQYADAILFSVLWNRTTLIQVTDALKQLTSIGIRASGLVLSNVDPKAMQKLGYGKRYGAYDRKIGRGYYKN